MKKLIAMLLVLAMVMGLVACGAKQETAAPAATEAAPAATEAAKEEAAEATTLKFWGVEVPSWNPAFDELFAGFEAETGIKVEAEFYPYEESEAKFQTSMLSKDGGADVYCFWGGWALDYTPNGCLLPLSDAMAESIRNDAFKPTYGALEYEGKIYGLPLEFNTECGGMLVNLHLLEEAGIAIPTTWDELVAAGEKLAKWNGDVCEVRGLDFVNYDCVMFMYCANVLAQGGQYLDADGKTVNLATPEGIKAFENMYDLVMNKKVTDLETISGGGAAEGYAQLFADTAAMCMRGIWAVNEGNLTFGLTQGEDFDYVEMPWYNDTPAFAAETGWSIAVGSSSQNQEAAQKFLEYVFRDDVMLKFELGCSMIPCKKSVALSDEFVAAMPAAAPLVNNLDKAQFIGAFNSDRFKDAINSAFIDYCAGVTATAEEALLQAEAKMNG